MANSPNDYKRVDDVASYLGVSDVTLKKWRLAGGGPPWYRLGGQTIVYKLAEVDEWVEKQRYAVAPGRTRETA